MTIDGFQLNLFQAYCELPNITITDDIIVGRAYIVAISNDGSLFTPKYAFYVHDSRCQQSQNISGHLTFSVKVNLNNYKDFCNTL